MAVADRLLKFATLAGASRRLRGIRTEGVAREAKAQAERSEMARWALLRSTQRFLSAVRSQRDAQKQKRMDSYADHKAMIAHSAWESALDWVEKLVESYEIPGQAGGE